MVTFNAGYPTNRQGRFTRSGAFRITATETRESRSLREATMPSADFCLITPSVTEMSHADDDMYRRKRRRSDAG